MLENVYITEHYLFLQIKVFKAKNMQGIISSSTRHCSTWLAREEYSKILKKQDQFEVKWRLNEAKRVHLFFFLKKEKWWQAVPHFR